MIAHCHPQKLSKSRGLCGSCYDRWLKQANPQYKNAQRLNTWKWKQNNPERYKVYLERRKAKQRLDPFYQRKRCLKHYGLTLETYDALLKKQDYGCAICKRRAGIRPLHVDHCHVSGQVRGLLCHQCNWYLGTLDQDKQNLERLLLYIGDGRSLDISR